MENVPVKDRGNQNLVKSPHHIPIAVYIQEADTLYHWAMKDKDALLAAGLSMEILQNLPELCENATRTEANWYVQLNSKQENIQEWEKQAAEAFNLRKQLLHFFRFAFRGHSTLMKNLKAINAGYSQVKKIQDLNDLAVMGRINISLLEQVHFDISLLDKAAQASADLSVLLANANRDRMSPNEAKKIRDLAYTRLKEAVDEIRFYARFVFHNDKERLSRYRSDYIRQLKHAGKKRRNKKEKIDN